MMAIQDELKALFQVVVTFFSQLFGFKSTRFKYTKELFIGTGLCALLGIAYIGYRFFAVSRDQTAQKAFSEYVHDYQLALKENNPQEWERVEMLFKYGRNQYSSSSLGAYFLVMLSEIQLRQNKNQEALETISQAVKEVHDPKILSLLRIKHALIQLDAQDQAMQDAGLQQLISLARDENNLYKDMALFYLGRYYWAQNKIDDAKKMWQELADTEWLDRSNMSPWVSQAKATLKQLSV